MLKLIKLEMRKQRLKNYMLGACIANLVIFAFTIFAAFISKHDQDELFVSYDDSVLFLDIFTRSVFMIFAAVLISRLIIDEFKNKSATVLFMYPIKRIHLLIAKLIIIVLFTFLAIVGSNLFLNFSFFLVNHFADFVPTADLTWQIMQAHAAKLMMNAASASCIALIPLFFGMRKHSGTTTIISSIFVAIVVSQNTFDFSLYSIVAIPIILGCVGILLTYLAIHDIERVDVL